MQTGKKKLQLYNSKTNVVLPLAVYLGILLMPLSAVVTGSYQSQQMMQSKIIFMSQKYHSLLEQTNCTTYAVEGYEYVQE